MPKMDRVIWATRSTALFLGLLLASNTFCHAYTTSYSGGDTNNGYFITEPSSYSYYDGPNFTTIVLSPSTNSVSDGQTSSNPSNGSPSSTSQMTYWVTISGPDAPSVPLLVSYQLQVNGSGSFYANAELNYGFGSVLLCNTENYGSWNTTCGGEGSAIFDSSYANTAAGQVAPNSPFEVSLTAWGQLGTGQASSYASSVDPFYSIDQNFAEAGQYSITFTPGVSNGTVDANEPGSLFIFGGAVVPLLLSQMFRRRAGSSARQLVLSPAAREFCSFRYQYASSNHTGARSNP